MTSQTRKTALRKIAIIVILAALVIQVTPRSCKAIQETNIQPFPVSEGEVLEAGSGDNFSIIWITDTQYLSESHPTYFDALSNWIVKNRELYNIKMVVHTGDLVEDEFNTTQWENANKSMSILLDNEIPYTWDAGNHDYNETCWIGDNYVAFNPKNLGQKDYWISDNGDGKSTAVRLTSSIEDFIIINIANQADTETLNWANNLLDANPNAHFILATHFYLNRTGQYESWALNLKNTVLATHPNIFLTLSAHVYPLANSGLRRTVGERHELLFNRQEKDSYMGSASLRILTFDLSQEKISVKTFYLFSNSFLTDSENQFVIDTRFYNTLNQDELDQIPEFQPWIIFILTSTIAVALLIKKIKKTYFKCDLIIAC